MSPPASCAHLYHEAVRLVKAAHAVDDLVPVLLVLRLHDRALRHVRVDAAAAVLAVLAQARPRVPRDSPRAPVRARPRFLVEGSAGGDCGCGGWVRGFLFYWGVSEWRHFCEKLKNIYHRQITFKLGKYEGGWVRETLLLGGERVETFL